MNYTPELHDYTSEECEKIAKDHIPSRNKDLIHSAIKDLIDLEFDRLEEYAGEFISEKAASRASKFLEKVLAGDEDAAKALFGADDSGRYVEVGCDAGRPWARMTNGNLFETGAIKTRRLIVEAHTDLIRNERIADLESIIDGLQQQIMNLEKRQSNY